MSHFSDTPVNIQQEETNDFEKSELQIPILADIDFVF